MLPLTNGDCSVMVVTGAVVEHKLLFHELLTNTPWVQETIPIFGMGYLEPRLTAWYADEGCYYAYHGVKRKINKWTPTLLSIKEKIEFICNRQFNSVLANYYRDGKDYMGYHADDQSSLGPQPIIASLSFGCERTFLIKNQADSKDKISTVLESGSLLIMYGNTQQKYVHSIPKMRKNARNFNQPRINLTFRSIVSKCIFDEVAFKKSLEPDMQPLSSISQKILPILPTGAKGCKLGQGATAYASGTLFYSRYELWMTGIHPRQIGGIAGNSRNGAESILFAGAWEKDSDYGDVLLFTGNGGTSKKSRIQSRDHELTRCNLALWKSFQQGLCIRVIRSWKLAVNRQPCFAPPPGQFRYDGLYQIRQFWMETNSSTGLQQCRFKFVSANNFHHDFETSVPATELCTRNDADTLDHNGDSFEVFF